jgi:transposase
MPYLPEDTYAELRGLSILREQLTEDRTRNINRLHRQMKIYFPEYADAFGKIDGTFATTLMKKAPFPEDIEKIGTSGIKEIWHEAKLRGGGYSRAEKIAAYAAKSVGLRNGTEAAKVSVKWYVQMISDITDQLKLIENELHEKCRKIPSAENILEIKGIGENILSGILAEMGDVSRFDDAKEIQKMSGLGLVACSSGKHKGQTKISHRGRKRLRYYLFQAARSAVTHAEEYRQLHLYYTTRADNPLKKMQSLIVIACKILRVIYTLLKTGQQYDPGRMLRDIKHPEGTVLKSAA